MKGYWKLKVEALDRTLLRIRFEELMDLWRFEELMSQQ